MADNQEMSGQADGATVPDSGSGLVPPVAEFDVEVKLIDPNSPLYSVKSFEQLGLSQEILKGLYKLNFRAPSKIQETALPLLLGNPPVNMIGQSQSGTGKTAAFCLNILSRLDLSSEQAQKTPQALVLAPTRELARQIIGVMKNIGEFIPNLKISAAIPLDPGMRGTQLDGQVVVGTPGSTTDMIRKRTMNATQIKTLVLDEADNMLDQAGMGDQCLRVKMLLPKDLQIVLFSATFPQKVKEFATKFAPGSNELTLKHEELTVDGIKQMYMDCAGEDHKYEVLVKLYGLMTIGSSIIFVKRRDTAVNIEKKMIDEGHKVVSLTGAYEPSVRDAIIDAFRSGQAKVLITTNVLARGIDVSTVNLVINYDVPDDGGRPPQPDPQTYLHRIGRTGRYGRVGAAITLIHDRASFMMMNQIAQYFNVEPIRIDTSDWDQVEETLAKILKSKAAAADFKPERADQMM